MLVHKLRATWCSFSGCCDPSTSRDTASALERSARPTPEQVVQCLVGGGVTVRGKEGEEGEEGYKPEDSYPPPIAGPHILTFPQDSRGRQRWFAVSVLLVLCFHCIRVPRTEGARHYPVALY